MAGVNIGNVGLTFTRYLDGVVESLNQMSKARKLVRQDDQWTGDHIEGRLHTARSPSFGYLEDGSAFASPDKQDYVSYKAYRKFIGGSIQLTDGVMATASKSKNVARDVITSEVEGLMNGMLKHENFAFFRDGTGIAATATTTAAAAATTLYVDDARALWDKARFQVYTTTVLRGDLTVTSVASAPSLSGGVYRAVVTVPALAMQVTAADVLYWNGSYGRAITGLSSLIDNTATTFQNVAVGTYPRYSSLVLSNSSVKRDLTPTLFRQMMAGIKQKSGSESPTDGLTVLCNNWGAINVEELYEGELRLTPESKVAGLAVASFQSAMGKVDIITDSDAPYGKMFFVDFSKIYRAVQKQLAWRREPGSGAIFKRSDVAGVWTATALEIAELYIKERHTSGRIDDLNETPATMY